MQFHDVLEPKDETELIRCLNSSPSTVIIPPSLLSYPSNAKYLMSVSNSDDLKEVTGSKSYDGVVIKASVDNISHSKPLLKDAVDLSTNLSIHTHLSCDLSTNMNLINTSSIVADLCDEGSDFVLLHHDNIEDIDDDSVRDLLEDIYNLDTDGSPFVNRVGIAFSASSFSEAALVEAVETGAMHLGSVPDNATEMKRIVEKIKN